MAFNGAILVSSYLNAWDDFNGPPFSNDRAYELYLPTMAATAWYHEQLDPRPADLARVPRRGARLRARRVRAGARQGASLDDGERAAVAAKLHRYTGMPEAFLRNANLRIDPSRFQKELLRGERRTVGRLDARFQGIDHDAAGEIAGVRRRPTRRSRPPSSRRSTPTSATTLGYKTDDLYKPTNYDEVGKDWDDRHRTDGGRAAMPDVAEDLRAVMSVNPHLQIFSANGYYDFATPFFETEYTLGHMGLDPSLEKNITFGVLPVGPHDLPARAGAEADEGRPREVLRPDDGEMRRYPLSP